jgi:hypothetical protein
MSRSSSSIATVLQCKKVPAYRSSVLSFTHSADRLPTSGGLGFQSRVFRDSSLPPQIVLQEYFTFSTSRYGKPRVGMRSTLGNRCRYGLLDGVDELSNGVVDSLPSSSFAAGFSGNIFQGNPVMLPSLFLESRF